VVISLDVFSSFLRRSRAESKFLSENPYFDAPEGTHRRRRVGADASAQTRRCRPLGIDASAKTARPGPVGADASVQTPRRGRVGADASAQTRRGRRVGADASRQGADVSVQTRGSQLCESRRVWGFFELHKNDSVHCIMLLEYRRGHKYVHRCWEIFVCLISCQFLFCILANVYLEVS